MTACVNKKSKRVAAVVTASLVGALSIGAPAVALAANNTNIDMLSVDIFTGAKVTRAKDSKGNVVADVENAVFAPGTYMIPLEVTNSRGDVTDVTTATVKYYSDKELQNEIDVTDDNEDFKTAGTYYLTIKKDNATSGAIAFKVANKSLANATAFEVNSKDAEDVSDTVFTYNGAVQKVGFVADGIVLSASDVEVKWYANGASGAGDNNAPTNAGAYTAVLTGKGSYQGSSKQVVVNVDKLDLSKAAVSLETTSGAAASNNSIRIAGVANDVAEGWLSSSAIVKSLVSNPNGGNYLDGSNGKWTFAVAAQKEGVQGHNANIVGEATVSFYKVASMVADSNFKYGEDALANKTFDASKGQAFDASEVKVLKGADEEDGFYPVEITYVDTKTGKAVESSALSNPGTYSVTVTIVPNEDDGWVGGSKTVEVTVQRGKINADKTVAFLNDGKLVSGALTKDFDGKNVLDSLTAEVKDAKGNLLEAGKDYTLVATKGTKKVDEIVDEGTYTVTVDAPGYTISGTASITVVVNDIDLSTIIANTSTMKNKANEDSGKITVSGNEFYVAYTGEAVAIPGVKYEVEKDGKYSYVDLDSSLFNVVSVKKKDGDVVKEAKDEGTYTVTIALTDAAKTNYALKSNSFDFTVKKFGHFTDVVASKWYAVAVETAYKLEYINGISGTNLFAPEADITRADAVCILFNMASGNLGTDADFGYTEDRGYVTGFSDVDGHAYYAKALAWANAADVANGSNGQFRPLDKITREEFASLLANFAKSKGDYKAVDADEVLGSATDYSAWAKQNVAWAKANKIMGNGGFINGTGNITRAEVAAMAVNYQPEKLPKA